MMISSGNIESNNQFKFTSNLFSALLPEVSSGANKNLLLHLDQIQYAIRTQYNKQFQCI